MIPERDEIEQDKYGKNDQDVDDRIRAVLDGLPFQEADDEVPVDKDGIQDDDAAGDECRDIDLVHFGEYRIEDAADEQNQNAEYP